MLNIQSILKEILKELQSDSDTIKIIDDTHILDMVSGVEFHLYDDYFQMTKEKDEPVSISSFSDAEKSIIMQLKDLITDPEVTKDKCDNYQDYIVKNRQRFSKWFENPTPVNLGVTEEVDTTDYVRKQ